MTHTPDIATTLPPDTAHDTASLHQLLEKYALPPEDDQLASRILVMLTARCHLAGHNVEGDFVRLQHILAQYQGLVRELRYLSGVA
ncbi:MAG: hypothetical protein SF053_20955 [Bacteroidia bacterium]|nr:hypothetical protein [Bacteroidia bacterium]